MNRRVAAGILVLSLALFTECHEHTATSGVDEIVTSCERAAAGEPFTSDEAYVTFVNAEAAGRVTTDAERGMVLVTPQGSVGAGAPALISFRPGAMARVSPREKKSPRCRRKPASAFWARVRSALVLERRAEAHCPAVSGESYLLRIVRADQLADHVYSALLSVTSFTPDPAIWRKALQGREGQTLAVAILRATFSKGDIIEGPFVAPAATILGVGP